jgi:predicted Zn-dependent peptidase
MAGFADGITDAALARAKTELAAEWRSAYVDQPYALVARKLQELLWPAHHPNAHLVLGDGRLRATLAQVRAFARQHITPSLTTLVIAGRFELQPTRELVKKYFAWIPPSKRGPSLARASAAPLAKSRTEAVVDPIPHVVVAFPIDKPYSPDAIAIEVAGHMLAGGRASRLSRKLADSASNVHAELVRQRSGCELVIEATPNPGVDAKSVFMQIVLEINELRRGTTDDEVRRAQAAVDSELVSALESLVFRADTLAAWADYTGDAQFLDRLRGTYHAVTADSIQRAANRWLATHAGVIATGGR